MAQCPLVDYLGKMLLQVTNMLSPIIHSLLFLYTPSYTNTTTSSFAITIIQILCLMHIIEINNFHIEIQKFKLKFKQPSVASGL
jgi:hypothetical protein